MATSDDDQLKYHFPTCNAPLSQLQSSTGIVYYGSCENPTDWSRMSTVIAKNRSASVNGKFTHVRLTTTDVKLGVEVVSEIDFIQNSEHAWDFQWTCAGYIKLDDVLYIPVI